MILFPYIQNETISHGKAAQILGINKLDLIAIYSGLGILYLDQTKEDLENDLSVLQKIRKSKRNPQKSIKNLKGKIKFSNDFNYTEMRKDKEFDPFYSEENMNVLRKSLKQLDKK